MSSNSMEVWLRLMGDALRGTANAQEAVRTLGEMPTTPDQLTMWMTRFMPNLGGATAQPDAFGDWLEDTWRMMGVVPRYRYLELLERHEQLRSRLEKAESEIKKLRKATLTGEVPRQEAQKVLDMWEGMLQETLKIQGEWIRGWTAESSSKQTPAAKGPTGTDEAESSESKNEEDKKPNS